MKKKRTLYLWDLFKKGLRVIDIIYLRLWLRAPQMQDKCIWTREKRYSHTHTDPEMMLSDQLNNNNQWIKWKTRNRALYITTDARRRRRCLRCCSIRNEMIFEALKKIQQTIKNINHPKNGAHQSKFSLWAMNYILRRLHLYSFVRCVLFFIVKWKKKSRKYQCNPNAPNLRWNALWIPFSFLSL